MPGIATQFVILERTIDKLTASGDPMLIQVAALLKDPNNSPYAFLGAIGPALADFIPSDPSDPNRPSTPSSPYASVWGQVLSIAGGDGTSANPGALKVIGDFKRILAKAVQIAQDEDLGALKDLRDSGEADAIKNLAAALKTIVDSMLPRVAAIGSGITTGMKPGVNVAPGQPTPPAVTWTAREWMFWKHPGRFATALVNKAKSAPYKSDPRLLAYAYGYLSSFAGSAVGSPFVNSTIGAAYRQQWWRYRWVNNYVDTWVHGKYASGATMAGDTPTPPYAQWPGLCDAKLEDRISIGSIDPVEIMQHLREGTPFPSVLPPSFGDFWMDAWTSAYGPPPLGGRFRAQALNGAAIMTWMKLWFQTSGDVIGCNSAPPMAPPDGCDGGAPSWVDPNVPGDNGSGQTPGLPEPESKPDVGEIVSGIILALLGVAAVIFGGALLGAEAVAVGIALVIDGATEINWAKLRCDLYWLQMYLYNGLKALHDLMTLGAFTHPYPSELALDTTTIQLLGIPYIYNSGKRIVKSRVLFPSSSVANVGKDSMGPFPSKPASGGLGDWVKMPTVAVPGIEEPQTTAYLTSAYPTFFIDDDAANPLTPKTDVKTGGSWPPGERRAPGSTLPVQFGNAVANAVDLIAHAGADLPDWNLDADRGMASLTWQFKNSTYTDPVQIEQEP
jgi:hypothetical protein